MGAPGTAGGSPIVAYADGPDGPLPEPAVLAGIVGRPVHILLGWTVRSPAWLAGQEGGPPEGAERVTCLMLGAGLRAAARAERVRPVAARLSAVPGLLAGRMRPDLAVVGAVEAPAGGGWRLVGSPGWALSAVRAAGRVVIERWGDGADRPAIGPELPECQIVEVLERAEPPDAPPATSLSPAHLEIGRLIAGLVPDGATIQWGPGAVGAAAVDSLDRPVRVHSGLVTDELAALEGRGLLEAPAEAAYLWGGASLHRMVASGRLVLREVGYTHDIGRLHRLPRFVAINTALQVGLGGSANVEVVGGRTVSGPGGHPDFAAGAAGSVGGLSVVGLVATSGGRSNIVSRPEVVSTPRSDVDVVVTEHGIADLRGCPDRERVARLIAIAAPEFRERLAGELR